jgi:hypothetical protein
MQYNSMYLPIVTPTYILNKKVFEVQSQISRATLQEIMFDLHYSVYYPLFGGDQDFPPRINRG